MIVCFIGHRTITDVEQVSSKLAATLTMLIEKGADTFIFGSKSDFDFLCWKIVTSLKNEYPNLKRISFNAPHETSYTSKEERQADEQLISKMLNQEVHFADYEESIDSVKSINANKNAYIMRNQEMIDNSDVCVFYYNKDYLPPAKKPSCAGRDRSKSGTAIAYAYAVRKKKTILNIY